MPEKPKVKAVYAKDKEPERLLFEIIKVPFPISKTGASNNVKTWGKFNDIIKLIIIEKNIIYEHTKIDDSVAFLIDEESEKKFFSIFPLKNRADVFLLYIVLVIIVAKKIDIYSKTPSLSEERIPNPTPDIINAKDALLEI